MILKEKKEEKMMNCKNTTSMCFYLFVNIYLIQYHLVNDSKSASNYANQAMLHVLML